MTETLAPKTNATPEAEVMPEVKPVPDKSKLSVLAQALLGTAEGKYAEIKAVADKQAKVGNVGELLSDAITNSTDKQVVELRAKREKAAAAILAFDKAMEEIVKPTLSIPTDEELAQMDTTYKTLASELNTFNGVFVNEVKKDHPEITLFDYTGELPGKRRGAKAGQGSGTSRPRVTSVEYTTDKNGEEGWKKAEKDGKSTFSHLSLAIKGETGETHGAGDFHKAWTESLGITDWTDAPEVSKFAYSVTDKNSKTHQYWVRVTR
jgi:hypothetical protein